MKRISSEHFIAKQTMYNLELALRLAFGLTQTHDALQRSQFIGDM
jgi:hypothetical protein